MFELDVGWGHELDSLSLGWTHGLAIDRDDNVYVHNRSRDSMVVVSSKGEVLSRWGEEFSDGAHGLTISLENDREVLWLADPERGLVVKTTLDGQELLSLGAPPVATLYYKSVARPDEWPVPGTFGPTEVAVAPDGRFFVADGYGAFVVHAFDAAGTHLSWWRGSGLAGGDFEQPHGLEVVTRDGMSLLYVADRANERIQVFTLEGDFVRYVTDDVGFICSVTVYDHEIFLADLHSRVTILDKSERARANLGTDQSLWQRENWPELDMATVPADSFVAPHAVAIDSSGDLYVAEWVPDGRVRKFRRLS